MKCVPRQRVSFLPYKNIKKISPPAKDYAFALAKIAESYIKGWNGRYLACTSSDKASH